MSFETVVHFLPLYTHTHRHITRNVGFGTTAFWRFAYDASQDFVLRILMVSGMASLLLGLVFGERKNIGRRAVVNV